jgi:hypothetical protein
MVRRKLFSPEFGNASKAEDGQSGEGARAESEMEEEGRGNKEAYVINTGVELQ